MNDIENKQRNLKQMLRKAPVVAVVVIDDAKSAVPMARALVAGGVFAIEVTLRTKTALDAIRAIAGEVEGAVAGAGTVLNAADYVAAGKAGARFIVSPGATDGLLQVAQDSEVAYLPGAATATEALALFDKGYRLQKFFPAEQAGGAAYLRALGGPLPHIEFCPTGGVTPDNASSYLQLPNVVCVGGSWLTGAETLRSSDWKHIETLAREAAQLTRG